MASTTAEMDVDEVDGASDTESAATTLGDSSEDNDDDVSVFEEGQRLDAYEMFPLSQKLMETPKKGDMIFNFNFNFIYYYMVGCFTFFSLQPRMRTSKIKRDELKMTI